MKNLLLSATLCLPLLLHGCYTPIVEGAQQGYDAARRDTLHAEAVSGDPVVQYKLGDTYCCRGGGPMDHLTVYDNHKATDWYCKSAHQGYVPAQVRLARVYSGHPLHGLHLALRASALVGTPETDLPIALMWASLAAGHSDEDGIALRDEITAKATDKELAKSATLLNSWRTTPCRWGEVFPLAANRQ